MSSDNDISFSTTTSNLNNLNRSGETSLDQSLKALNRIFKLEIRPEIMSRKDSEVKNRKRKRNRGINLNLIEKYDELTAVLLDRIGQRQTLAEKIRLINSEDLPEGDERIKGVVIIIEIERSGRYIIGVDKVKQLRGDFPRFSFPGGRVTEGESLSRTVIRELFEETRIKARGLKFYFIAVVPIYIYDESGAKTLSEDHKILLLYTRIGEAEVDKLKAGREQNELRIFEGSEINSLADGSSDYGELLPNHRNYWFVFNLWKSAGINDPVGDIRAH